MVMAEALEGWLKRREEKRRERIRKQGREEVRKEILDSLEDVDLPEEVRSKVLALLNGDHEKPEE